MDDRQLLEEHGLNRARLVGCLLHGSTWRQRRVRGTVRRIAAGLVLAVVACAVIAAVSFVSEQLRQQQEEQRRREQQFSSAPRLPVSGSATLDQRTS